MITAPPMVGRAALGGVAARAVLADLLAVAAAAEQPHDRGRARAARRSAPSSRRPGRTSCAGSVRAVTADPAAGSSSAAATRSSPAEREALTSTTSPGASSLAQQRDGGVDVVDVHRLRSPTSPRARRRRGCRRPPRRRRRAGRGRAARRSGRGPCGRSRASSPSSAIGPRTAQVRRRLAAAHDGERLERGPHRLGVGVVGVVDDGDAVGPLGDLHAPAADRARPRRAASATCATSSVDPAPSTAAATASALATWCSPRSCRRDVGAPCGATQRERRPARRRRARTSSARTSASGAVPKVDDRARSVRGRACRARSGSSALSTTSVAGRLDQLALGLGDALAAAELAEVGAADVEHDGDVRAGDARRGRRCGRRRGRSTPATAKRVVRRPAQRRQRQAELVVERALRARSVGAEAGRAPARAGPWWRSCRCCR